MKKYLHTDGENVEKDDKNAPATEDNSINHTSGSKKDEIRQLPSEESLFEFDDTVFAEDMPEKPKLTPEEAEYAEELSEKFGISRDAGVSFLDDTPAEDEGLMRPFIAPEIPQSVSEVQEQAVDTTEQAEFAAEQAVNEMEQAANETEQAVNEAERVMNTAEQVADEADQEKIEAELDYVMDQLEERIGELEQIVKEKVQASRELRESEKIVSDTYEDIKRLEELFASKAPDDAESEKTEEPSVIQTTFDGMDGNAELDGKKAVEEKPSEKVGASGVQLTFLDTELATDEEDEPFEEEEQIGFGDYEDEYDNIDEDDEADEVEEADEPFEDASNEPENDETDEINEVDDEPSEPIYDTAELTPIELNAIEQEAERARAEAEAATVGQEVELVKTESYETDIWDEEDKAEFAEKERFDDFCARLDIPPIKITKEARASTAAMKLPTSGYRYEMTERLPLFPEGLNGGKRTESYVSKEIAYCEEREKKRSEQLLGKLRFTSLRLIGSFVIMLTVLLLENLNVFFGGKPDGLLTGDKGFALSITVAVLLTVGAIFVFDSICDGIKSAVNGVFIPETLTAGVVIPSIVYHFAIAFFFDTSSFSILFGTGSAVVMFLSGLYRYNMLKRDQTAFSVTSSYGDYVTEVKMVGFKDTPEGRAYEGYASPDSSLYKLNKLSRVDASYNDNPVRDECFGILRKLSLIIVCAAVVAGVVFGFLHKDTVYGVLSAISLITYSAPASVFIALSYPRLRAATASAEYGGAIVDFDDESDEFDESVIMLDEGELFPPEMLTSSGFDVQRSPGIELHLSRTLALFKKIGGSFEAMFSSVEGTIQSFESVVITEIASDGISAKIDGTSISAGSEAYMNKLGIKIKRSDKLLPKNGRVMYVADNGEFFARATLIFKADDELVQKISELRNTGMLFSLKTCNPCIDEELLFHTTGLEPELLRLIKYEAGDDVAPSATDREGSVVSKNGALGLLTALLEYKRQKKLIFEATRFACVACAVGAFVSLITSAIKGDFGYTSLLMLATHGVLSAVAFVLSKRGAINTKSKIKKK